MECGFGDIGLLLKTAWLSHVSVSGGPKSGPFSLLGVHVSGSSFRALVPCAILDAAVVSQPSSLDCFEIPEDIRANGGCPMSMVGRR